MVWTLLLQHSPTMTTDVQLRTQTLVLTLHCSCQPPCHSDREVPNMIFSLIAFHLKWAPGKDYFRIPVWTHMSAAVSPRVLPGAHSFQIEDVQLSWTLDKWWIATKISMSHAIFGACLCRKNYSLFIWNSNLTGNPLCLVAKSGSHQWLSLFQL